MAKRTITINEALAWAKTLKMRHGELQTLRNENSYAETRYIGANAEKQRERTPVYDVVALDRAISNIAREMRVLDTAIKMTNATTNLAGYEQDDDVLGELVPAKKE
jgi:hypothetical protein